MRFFLIAMCWLSMTAWADSAGPVEQPASTLRAALELPAPDYLLSRDDQALQLAKKAACKLASAKTKGLLKTCTYECPCGKKTLRRKGKQECPKTWKFEC